MAEDDLKSEQFIREVDEEFRRAQIKGIWDRFAPLIVAVCLLVVLGTAGYRGWLWWQARQAASAGDVYLGAVEKLGTGDGAEGEATLNRLASEGGGYGALARMRLAAAKVSSGDKAGAVAQFDAIADDTAVSTDFRDLARLRAGLLELDLGDYAGAKMRVEGLAVPGNAWRHGAREVLGTAAFASGDVAAARTSFQSIQADAEAPQDFRSRAELMMGLIEAQGTAASPATPAVEPSTAPAAAASDAAPADTAPSAESASPDAAVTAPDEPAADFAEPATIPGLETPTDEIPGDAAATPGLAIDGGPDAGAPAGPDISNPDSTAVPAGVDGPATIPTPDAGSAPPTVDSEPAPVPASPTETPPAAAAQPTPGAANEPATP